MYEYGEDPEKKALVAEKETELRNKLKKLRTAYKKLEQECKAEYQTASAPHTAEIEARKQDIKTKKEHRKATLAKIIEGVRPELEELLKKIADKRVSIDWKNIKLEENTLRVFLVYEDTVELSSEDYNLDDGEPYVNLDELERDLEDTILETAFNIAASLDFEEAEIDPWIEAKDIRQIPGTDWEMDIEPLVDIEEPYCSSGSWSGDGWYEPREFDFEYDSETKYYLTFYLYRDL
jgi:DNA repair exonuclease SbcCD ATPase subunit